MALRLKERILIELYLIKIKSKLQYPCKAKKLELKEYREIIYNVVENGKILDKISDLYDEFAKPDQYAHDVMDLMDERDKASWQKERKAKSIVIFFIILLLTILLTFIFTVRFSNRNNEFSDGVEVVSSSLNYDEEEL